MTTETRLLVCQYQSYSASILADNKAGKLRLMVLAYGGRCESILNQNDDSTVDLWGIFASEEIATLFKLTHM